jgi:hypothetical protein
MTQLEALTAELKLEFSDFQIMPKSESRSMRFIGFFLQILSLGKNKSFMKEYESTINHTMYTGESWNGYSDIDKIVLIRHERVHMRQQKLYGRFVYSFLYMFTYFPLFFAKYRTEFEMEAYEEQMRAMVQYHGTASILRPDFKIFIIEQFTTSAYLWAWPFQDSIEKWFNEAREKIIEDYVTKP